MDNRSPSQKGYSLVLPLLPETFNRPTLVSAASMPSAGPPCSANTRRYFLKTVACAAATTMCRASLADEANFWERPRELWLYNSARKEQIKVVYFEGGQIDQEAYSHLCWFMRDAHVNKMVAMDPVLLDVLHGIQGFYQMNGWNYPIVLNSGFRSIETNNRLLGEGAAKNSMHLYGKAADVYMPGAPIQDVARLGLHFRQGGVGFYETKKFVHIDTGRVRVWRG